MYRLVSGSYTLQLPTRGTLTLHRGERIPEALYEHVPKADRRRFTPADGPSAIEPAVETRTDDAEPGGQAADVPSADGQALEPAVEPAPRPAKKRRKPSNDPQ